jgi:neutral ceramidase
MFGRWQLPAYLQEVTKLAMAMRDGAPADPGTPPAPAATPRPARVRRPTRTARRELVDVQPSYAAGDEVRVTVAVPDPRGRARPSYLVVETADGTRVAADGDWATTIEWHYDGMRWTATLTWRIPADATGTFRLRYLGDVLGEFAVTSAPAPRAAATAPATGR